jgi:hypothetical protein
VAQIKDIALHEILVDYDNMVHSSESLIKSIKEMSHKDQENRYEEFMKAAENIMSKNDKMAKSAQIVVNKGDVLDLPDIKLGKKFKFNFKDNESQRKLKLSHSIADTHNYYEYNIDKDNNTSMKVRDNQSVVDSENKSANPEMKENQISGSFILSESNHKDLYNPASQELFMDPNAHLQEYNTEMKVCLYN